MADQPITVLIVDDDPDGRESMGEVLKEHGYKVVLAATGNQALQALTGMSGRRLAVIDFLMPGMDGRNLVRIIKNDSRLHSCKVIVMSGMREVRIEGADRVLAKPFAPDSLIKVVAELSL